ncbi:MAG: hypothetical protein V3V00_13960 [Saprospiraceae bacterium]
MRILIIIAIALLSTGIFAQDGMSIQLEKTSNPSCLSITLTLENTESVLLKGQNYRLFYNNHNLEYTTINVNAELAINNFGAQIAIHRDNLYKKINGKIPFESKMGFISMNIMPENEILDHVYMAIGQKVNIADVCFAQEVSLEDVILASKEITSEYSRAYCVIDWEAASSLEQFSIDLESLSEENIDENK